MEDYISPFPVSPSERWVFISHGLHGAQHDMHQTARHKGTGHAAWRLQDHFAIAEAEGRWVGGVVDLGLFHLAFLIIISHF